MLGMSTGVVGTGMLSFVKLGDAAAETEGRSAETVKSIVSENDVVLFVRGGCPYCSQARDALNDAGIHHEVVDANRQIMSELVSLTGIQSLDFGWNNHLLSVNLLESKRTV